MLTYHRTTEEEKYLICNWRYEGEYAVYNTPPYNEQRRARRGFADPKNCFYSFYDGETLVGYMNLVEEADGVFFGTGVNPARCNQGYGQEIGRTALAVSRERYPGKPVYLEVRTWNRRAIRCYEKAGFRIDGAPVARTTPIGEGMFYHMTAEP